MAQAGWADDDCTGTWTWRSPLRGSAERKAMSSLERVPQAPLVRSKTSAVALQTERIIHSGGKLGVSERLVLVDVVEEVVHPAPRDRGEARREPPGKAQREAGREGEEGLAREIAPAGEGAREVEEREPGARRGGERVGEVEVAEERRAARQLAESDRDRVHLGEPQRRGAAAHGEIDTPGQPVPEIVAGGELHTAERGRGEEPVASGGVEEDLVAARAEERPARPARPLLRIVFQLAAAQSRVGDLHQLRGNLHLADEERVLDALLDQVVARSGGELPRSPARLGHLGDGLAAPVEDDVDALVRGAEDEATAGRIQLGEDHVARAAQIVEVDRMLGAGARLGGGSDG